MAIIEYVDQPNELRPARPPISASTGSSSTPSTSSSTTSTPSKHQTLNEKVTEILAKQEQVKTILKQGTIPTTITPNFPQPTETLVTYKQFETIKNMQYEYAQQQNEIKRNALLNKIKKDNTTSKKDTPILQ